MMPKRNVSPAPCGPARWSTPPFQADDHGTDRVRSSRQQAPFKALLLQRWTVVKSLAYHALEALIQTLSLVKLHRACHFVPTKLPLTIAKRLSPTSGSMTKCFGLLVLALFVFAGSNAHSTRVAGDVTELLTPSRASGPPAEPKSKRSDPDRDVPTNAADEDRTMSSLTPVVEKLASTRQIGYGKTLDDLLVAGTKVHSKWSLVRAIDNSLKVMMQREIKQLETIYKRAKDQVGTAEARLAKATVKAKNAALTSYESKRATDQLGMAKEKLKLAKAKLRKAATNLAENKEMQTIRKAIEAREADAKLNRADA